MPNREDNNIHNREAAVAGRFYPGSPSKLSADIKSMLKVSAENKEADNVRALIVPHAGYVYSGKVAAAAFSSLNPDQQYKNVFLIGSSHRMRFNGASLFLDGDFNTPLGTARVNRDIGRKLVSNGKSFSSLRQAHDEEHSLEVQIPFLQIIMGDSLSIIPILIGSDKASECHEIAKELEPYFVPENLFLISTDFSHYPEYNDAIKLDKETIDEYLNKDPDQFATWIKRIEKEKKYSALTPMCGWTAGLVLKYLALSYDNLEFKHLAYSNSGDIPGADKGGVVGYHALSLIEQDNDGGAKANKDERFSFSDSEKATLLSLARKNIEARLRTGSFISPVGEEYSGKLKEAFGAFVTLKIGEKLRGCIGRLTSSDPLYETINILAASAAFSDSRFDPLSISELDKVSIEISVLSPLKKIESIDDIVLGKHGIMIKKGFYSGTFLPQVASEREWSLMELLTHLSEKAGLGREGWKGSEMYIYEAFIIDEKFHHG